MTNSTGIRIWLSDIHYIKDHPVIISSNQYIIIYFQNVHLIEIDIMLEKEYILRKIADFHSLRFEPNEESVNQLTYHLLTFVHKDIRIVRKSQKCDILYIVSA